MEWESHQLPAVRLLEFVRQRFEQCGICIWVPERLTRCVKGRDSTKRQQKAHVAFTLVEPVSDPATLLNVLLNCGSHQRDLRVMRIQVSRAIVRRHSLHRAEIYHVERATGTHIWSLAALHSAEAIISARQNTPEQVVTDFGGGDVDYAADEAVVQESLHGLSTHAGGVKYQAIEARAKQPYHVLYARCRHAEHAEPQGWTLVTIQGQPAQHHARKGVGRISNYTT